MSSKTVPRSVPSIQKLTPGFSDSKRIALILYLFYDPSIPVKPLMLREDPRYDPSAAPKARSLARLAKRYDAENFPCKVLRLAPGQVTNPFQRWQGKDVGNWASSGEENTVSDQVKKSNEVQLQDLMRRLLYSSTRCWIAKEFTNLTQTQTTLCERLQPQSGAYDLANIQIHL
jgi:hypothetical protein